MFKKKGKIVTLGIITSFVLGAFLFSGVTLGAFLNNLEIFNNIESSPLTAKFAGGSGTINDPFQINTSDHLRNLQKLNMIDIFKRDTHFIMSGDINWSGDNLLPIGTEDHPFEGQFDGKGHIISNLVVDGKDTEDIGMFGYTGINSRIKNLILVHPTINVLTNSDGSGISPSTNVLSNDKNVNILSKSTAIDVTSADGNNIIVPKNLNVTLENGSVVDVIYESSNPNVFDPTIENDTLKYPTGEQLYGELYTFQIIAKIQYIDVKTLKVYDYVLERYNIELKCVNNTVTINQYKGKSNIYRTKNRLNKDNQYDDHGLNVGFFIGHCDGGASYLGLYGGATNDTNTNGIINLNGRKAQSTGSLIGRDRMDNPYDNTAHNFFNKFFDFNNAIDNAPSTFTSYNSELDEIQMPVPTKPANKDARPESNKNVNSAKIISDQNQRAKALTDVMVGDNKPGIDDKNKTSFYARYYPKAIKGDTTGTKNLISLDSSTTAMRVDSGLKVGGYITGYKTKGAWGGFNTSSKDYDFYAENGLWFWATKHITSGFLNTLFAKDIKFDATIKLKYIVNLVDGASSTTNSFVLKNNTYDIGRIAKNIPVAGLGGPETYEPSGLGSVCWGEPTYMDTENVEQLLVDEPLLDPSKGDMAGQIIEKEIKFSYEQKVENKDTLSPMFALGIGNKSEFYRTNSPSKSKFMEFGSTNTYYNSHYLNGFLLLPDETAETAPVSPDNTVENRYAFDQRFYYEIEQDWDPNVESIDILNMDLSFTTKDGNTSTVTNNVDFLYTNPANNVLQYVEPTKPSDSPFKNWDTSSNTKIQFILDADGQKAVNNYYRSKAPFGPWTTVYCDYSSQYANYNPTNTKGYSSASINKI